MELEDAIHIALLTLKDSVEGEMNGETIEIGEFGNEIMGSRPRLICVK